MNRYWIPTYIAAAFFIASLIYSRCAPRSIAVPPLHPTQCQNERKSNAWPAALKEDLSNLDSLYRALWEQ